MNEFVRCPKCKISSRLKLDEIEKLQIHRCNCGCEYVTEIDITTVIREPDCLYGDISNCEYDCNGQCVNCGEYNSNFDWKD